MMNCHCNSNRCHHCGGTREQDNVSSGREGTGITPIPAVPESRPTCSTPSDTLAVFESFRSERETDRRRQFTHRRSQSATKVATKEKTVFIKVGILQQNKRFGSWRRTQGTLSAVQFQETDTYEQMFEKAKVVLGKVKLDLNAKDMTNVLGTPLNVVYLSDDFSLHSYHKQLNLSYKDIRIYLRHFEPNSTDEGQAAESLSTPTTETVNEDSDNSLLSLGDDELPSILSLRPRNLGDEPPPVLSLRLRNETIQNVTQNESGDISSDEVDQVFADSTADKTTAEIMECHAAKTICTEQVTISALREDVWASFEAAKARRGFSFFKIPKIDFVEEAAVDDGGPKREFMLLLLQKFVQEKGLFEGSEGKLYLASSVEQIERKAFIDLGMIFSWSVLHGGPGLHCLMSEVYHLMLDNNPNMSNCLDFITDTVFVTNVKKIQDSDIDHWREAVSSTEDYFINFGSDVYKWTYGEKRNIVNMLIKHFLYRRNKQAYDHFVEGMNRVGRFWHLVQRYPKELQPLFVHEGGEVSYSAIKELLQFSYSESGSNNERAEKRTAHIFQNFLLDLEDKDKYGPEDEAIDYEERNVDEIEVCVQENKISLKHVLKFLTGCDSIPPIGFKRKITVSFFDHVLTRESRIFPTVSTCGLTITIPRHVLDGKTFDRYMKIAIRCGSDFFGRV